MNKVLLVARLTREPELRTTANGVSVTSFNVAVNRRYKNADGGYDADFPNCVAYRQTAEFIAKNFTKGQQIGLVGSIQTRTYDDKEGKKVYVTEVAVDEAYFVGDKVKTAEKPNTMPVENDGFMPAPASDDDDLPF